MVLACSEYERFFLQATGVEPYPYQQRLAVEPWPDLLDVPTGLGKTAAVTLAWLHRQLQGQAGNPRRLVWCLPMRVLVEQTRNNIAQWLERLAPSFAEAERPLPRIQILMGGETDLDWVRCPEDPAILVGTQDMLLSRALLRGYGMSRYQWPMHFSLLHNDALWVFDEVQLMGTGLATTAQLEGLRRRLGSGLPCHSLWVSATLNPDWLGTVDFLPHVPSLTSQQLTEAEQRLPGIQARREAPKTLARARARLEGEVKNYLASLAEEIVASHHPDSTTLVVMNTVERAQALAQQLVRSQPETELLLIHARFRAAERQQLEQKLTKAPAGANRIVVSTQAIEAGVDFSCRVLFTELAPWSSLVQRFGRCNRYGEWNEEGGAEVYWVDVDLASSRPAPYAPEQLAQSRALLQELTDVASAQLPPVREPAEPALVLRQRDLLELFDTEPDLSGFDIDVSPYVRDATETDVQVFWRNRSLDDLDGWAEQSAPRAEELCRASMGQMDAYFKRVQRNREAVHVWDALAGRWTRVRRARQIRPGQTLMLDASLGGYDSLLGFLARSRQAVEVLPGPMESELEPPESSDSDPRSFIGRAVPLTEHLNNVHKAAIQLCAELGVDEAATTAVVEAARWHDVGKAHPAFQNMLRGSMAKEESESSQLWAKSSELRPGAVRYALVDEAGREQLRPHFRHELASMLAWLQCHGDRPDADLIAWLIVAHHGKVRMGLRAHHREAEPGEPGRLHARGVWAGDLLPPVPLDEQNTVPELVLQLDLMQLGMGEQGASWTARSQHLLREEGPFRLAWLESLVRIADWRASEREQLEGEQSAQSGEKGA